MHVKKQALLFISVIFTTILVIGCSSKQPSTNIFYPVVSGSENAQTKLAEAAVSSSDSLIKLAAIEKATHPNAKLSSPLSIDKMNEIGLGALTSIDWTGPIEPVVKELAIFSDYTYRVIGKRPAIPVLVAIYAINMPVADILRDINYQAGSKADIVVYPSRKIIELRYRNEFDNGYNGLNYGYKTDYNAVSHK
jgi:defect-in-organelle-trafficking protein DotD